MKALVLCRAVLAIGFLGQLGACSEERQGADAASASDARLLPADGGSARDARSVDATPRDTGLGDTGLGAVDAGASAGPCPRPPPQDYVYTTGVGVFGDNDYIEYIPGDLPIIISAPHGGTLEPAGFAVEPNSLSRDGGSRETALLVRRFLGEATGRTPHLVINHITRDRLNLNRSDARPNAGNPAAVQAYDEFHAFIGSAKAWVTASCVRGHYFDFHTNGHDARWVEIGIALSASQLALPENDLIALSDVSTYRALAAQPGVSFLETVRGPTSLGGLLDAQGVLAVPSPTFPHPDGEGFFNGGFNVRAHGSRQSGTIDGSQIEMHFQYINSGATQREAFARQLTTAIVTFVETHYGFDLDAP